MNAYATPQSVRPPIDHPWCIACRDTGEHDRDGGEGCRECPVCALCKAPLACHDPGAHVIAVATVAPYGRVRTWHIVRDCAPVAFGQWLKTLYVWDAWTGAYIRALDTATGMRRGTGARIL